MKIRRAASTSVPVVLSILMLAAATSGASADPGPDTQVSTRQPHRELRRAPGPSAIIPTGGGSIALAGFASVVFAPATFSFPQLARVEKTSSSATAQAFADSAGIFQPGSTPGYEIRITTGPSKPQAPVEVSLVVPSDFVVPEGSRVEAFAQFWEQDELDALDSFELISSTFDESARTVTLTLPPSAFTAQRRGDGTFEAIVTLAATPGAGPSQALSVALAAAGATILPPLETTQVRSPFNPARQVTVGGKVYTGHWGTDFIAADGTPIFATGDGKVLRAYNSGDKSFGNSVLLRMKNAGVVRYAHLQTYFVDTGDAVLAGQEIGLTDNTGLSTGAHLHFELAPDGNFASNKSKVDPAPLLEDRPLTWHLTANAVYESRSLIPGIINENRLQLRVEADLLMVSDGSTGMSLTLQDGTLFAQSYTGQYDKGSNTICTFSLAPQSYPMKMNDGVSLPAEGDTTGGMELQRDHSQVPSTRYTYSAAFTTDQRPEYTESCPSESPVTHPIYLSAAPWMQTTGPGPFRLDPLADTTTGGAIVDSSIPGYVQVTTTYDWTLQKTY
jgi:murein DD-endopeptidase MepM/ murein hydrolase activator NlpD